MEWLMFTRNMSAYYLVLFSLLLASSSRATSQTINMSLNITSLNETGGTWNLTVATNQHGLAGLQVFIKDVSTINLEAPTAKVNNNKDAGFSAFHVLNAGAYKEVVIGQVPLNASEAQAPNTQNIFYEVGTMAGATPTSSGLIYNNLTNLTGSPWGGAGQGAMANAVVVLSGTFIKGQYPLFYTAGNKQPAANVFMSVGTESSVGSVAEAVTFHMWHGYPGDGNLDGKVNAADYTVWRDNLGAGLSSMMKSDYDRNGITDAADYTLWKSNFGTNVLE
jgi:hypothetical protein